MNRAYLRALGEAKRRGLNYLPGEVMVKFKEGVNAEGQARALSALGIQPTAETFEWAGRVAIVRNEVQQDAYVLADQMKAQPEVEYAEPNFIVSIDPVDWKDSPTPPQPARTAVRPTRGSNAGVTLVPTDTDYASYQWNFQLINMPGAWDVQPGGRSDIIVAVIDSGVTSNTGNMVYPVWTGSSFQTLTMPYGPNSDLPASRHVLAKDFPGALIPGAPHVDTSGHGTHVASTIGEATNNGFLVSGIAYNVQIMPLKVCTSYWDIAIAQGQTGQPGFPTGFTSPVSAGCSYAYMAQAIDYAVANGARVMNISIGGGAPSSTTLQNALINAANKGAFVSISMGNDFNDGNPTNYPAFYAQSIDGVMSVASIGPNSTKASYSSTGAHCEIAAPGGDSVGNSARVDQGYVWQSTVISSDHPLFGSSARFDRYNRVGFVGTSMAAPHVAGLAALLMSQVPTLTGAQAERIIRASAKDLGAAGKDDTFGYGLIQPRRALFGYGPLR